MSALPLRPALADVLRALTSDLHGTMESALAGDQISLGPKPYFECRTDEVALLAKLGPADRRSTGCKTGIYSSRPWITRDPIEAFETLISRGVLPDSWAGDERRAFVCTATMANGAITPHPTHIPELVAWASLGPAAILRAEELARETVRRLRPWDAPQPERVVWRVGGRRKADSRLDVVDRFHVIHTDGSVSTLHDADAYQPIAEQEREIMEATGTVRDLWRMGLALDSITADAVTIVVPPIGGEA